MRHFIQLTLTISFLTLSPLSAQELPTHEWQAIHFRDAGLTYSGSTTLSRVQDFDDDEPLWHFVLGGGILGALGGGVIGFLYGIVEDCTRIDDDPGYGTCGGFADAPGIRTSVEENSCVEKNCLLIATAIGAGVGFGVGAVVGGIYGAVRRGARPSGRGGRRRRANVIVVPLHNGRLGIGASVRF